MNRYANLLHDERSRSVAEQVYKLQSLVDKYSAIARSDPELRLTLLTIARQLGIDPFTLGNDRGSFNGKDSRNGKNVLISKENQLKISVLCIEICQDLQSQNGGNVPVQHLRAKIEEKLGFEISSDEVANSIKSLEVLGTGLRLETLPNGQQVIRNVASELSSEQGDVLVACDALGYVTTEILTDNLNWDEVRSQQALDKMVSCGLLWIDGQSSPKSYWSTSSI